ncbi:hypothetical protein [Acinetobacter pittii]|uniref:hypothetical protein n=1 Tax=Acinetobacter pittii TaxID=48296 RepID=UPI001CD27FB8|nr:hypothetical protein [Acinetobacter pittii]
MRGKTINEFLPEDVQDINQHTILFNPKEPFVRSLILNVLADGDHILRMAVPKYFKEKTNPVNQDLSRWLESLNDKIMKYRNILDTLD